MAKDYVEDDEELYRSVRADKQYDEFDYSDEGKLIVTYQAFKDANRTPSVDRAKLRDFIPQNSRLNNTDGIVSLYTRSVRAIGDVCTRKSNIENKTHSVDVFHRPKNRNTAHSQVEVDPEFFGSENKKKKSLQTTKKGTCSTRYRQWLDTQANPRTKNELVPPPL